MTGQAPTEAARIAEEALVYSEPGSRMRILAEAVLAQRDVVAAARQLIEAQDAHAASTSSTSFDTAAALNAAENKLRVAAVVSGTPPPTEGANDVQR